MIANHHRREFQSYALFIQEGLDIYIYKIYTVVILSTTNMWLECRRALEESKEKLGAQERKGISNKIEANGNTYTIYLSLV